ncbi:MAG: acyl-CoA dehydrogenase family protein [Pseudomonadales bacterium]
MATAELAELEEFRQEIRSFIEGNCPDGARGQGEIAGGGKKFPTTNPDLRRWMDTCAERGLTVPMWPKEYGGAGIGKEEFMILIEELRRARARTPLAGMGTGLIGPTILEFGTHEQKLRHLIPISRGEFRWCQGYSEPSAGSDLASLRTRAEDKGDHFLVNGQKIWTSGAQFADWIFMLVRTDPDVPKHEGISFLLLDMDQPGITPRPIRLISGESPFCETFFDNAIARKDDLIGELNKGWTVGKRLLQHERSSLGTLVGGQRRDPGPRLGDVAKRYLGEVDGRIDHADVRARVIRNELNGEAFRLTQKRTVEETKDAKTPGPATSMFKVYGSELMQQRIELTRQIRGVQGLGWEGDAFSQEEIESTRTWLSSRAMSIYSGSNEIQRNIIAKRVLGLPD